MTILATFNPETAPYGGSFYNCGGYGSMQFDMCLAQMVGVNEPVVSTETGYASGMGLSDAIIGRYELRILFESLRLGIVRTFLYELIDDPSSLNYGLLTGSFSPRPAYTAIQNVLSLLKDASFAQPGKLDYTLGWKYPERTSSFTAEERWHLLPGHLARCAERRSEQSINGLRCCSAKRDPQREHPNRRGHSICP